MSKRVLYLDNLSGLLIVQMIILVHIRIIAAQIPDNSFLYDLQSVFVFFIPWFFFKSGMFYKRKGIFVSLKHDAKKLLWTYLLFSLFAYAMQVGCTLISHEPLTSNRLLWWQLDGLCSYASVPWNQALWFLPIMFIVKNVFNVIGRFIPVWLILLASLFLAYLFSDTSSAPFDFWIGTTSQSLFFYSLGVFISDRQYRKPLFLASSVVYVFGCCLNLTHGWDARLNCVGDRADYFVVIIVLMAGIILFDNIFKRLLDKSIPIMTYVGQNAMLLFVAHFPFVMVLRFYILPHFHLSGTMSGFWLCCILMAFYLSVVYCADRLIRQKLNISRL